MLHKGNALSIAGETDGGLELRSVKSGSICKDVGLVVSG